MIRRWIAGGLAVTFVVMSIAIGAGSPASATGAAHGPIEGSGSSWSSNAVNLWVAQVSSQGLQIVFTASGSAQGRKDYAFRNVDFAVSDIAYQGVDSVTNETDTSQGRPYVYLPIVAGGTAFPYQIKVAGKKITNLRLSGATLTKIFTNKITNWDDPQITADNNGRKLPSIPIIPVVHSEGSGSTAQFTAYMASQDAGLWGPYNGGRNVMTEYYPRKGQQVSQNGSDGVMNFVASAAANGAIGYDEYSYARNARFPVVKLENAAGYFTLPDAYNVAKSLTQAQLDNNPASPTYLIEDLTKVYTYNDPRTYPMSSYSYMILPTGTNAQDSRLSTPKRQTLVDFMYYAICAGQRQMGPIGYSPLPVNLVQDGFAQLAKLKAADGGVNITQRDVSTCNNPTFVAGHPDQNYLAQIAPLPQACDKVGAGPCTSDAAVTNPTAPPTSGTGTGASPGTGTGTGTGTNTGTSTGTNTGTGDPNQPGGGAGGGPTSAPDDQIVPVPAALEAAPNKTILTPLVILELLAVLVVPVVLQRLLTRRGRP